MPSGSGRSGGGQERVNFQEGPASPPDKGMYKFVDLEGKWLSGAFSVLNRWVDRGIVAS